VFSVDLKIRKNPLHQVQLGNLSWFWLCCLGSSVDFIQTKTSK